MIIDKIDKTAKFTGEAGCGWRLTWGICTIKRDFTQCIFIFLLFTWRPDALICLFKPHL